MLYVSYGLQKSASTFCWQLACEIVESAGFLQSHLRQTYLPAELSNGFVGLDRFDVRDLAAAIPPEALLVLKTHSPLSNSVRDAMDRGIVKASVTYRDPRDCAVALLDVAERDRQRGLHRGFAEVGTMREAIELIAGNLWNTETWLSDPRVLRVPFDDLANRPLQVVRRLGQHLGIPTEADRILSPFQTGQKAIGEFNQGVSGRYQQAMKPEDLAWAEERFGRFIQRFIAAPVVLQDAVEPDTATSQGR
jgi:hypothetical protein